MRLRHAGRQRSESDFATELESHLDMHIDDSIRAGMTPEEARRQAVIRLGGLEQTRQAYREQITLPSIQSFRQDLLYALRQLRKAPGFTTVAVLTLALGIGFNTSVFSFLNALFLKALAVSNPEQLVRIYARGPSGHYGAGFSYPEFKQLRDHSSSLEALSIEAERPQLHLVANGDSEEIRGEFVSANYFTLLGIQPRLGRGFLPEEDAALDRDAVAVISDQLWARYFNRDPAALGSEIRINGMLIKVIGIAPPKFDGDLTGLPADIWLPAMMFGPMGYGCTDGTYQCSLFDAMIGRVKARESAAQVQAEADSLMVWSATNWPERPSRRQIAVTSANGESPDDQADDLVQLHLLMSVTACLLLIACVNLAGLLLARGVTRKKEITIRLSIGASRRRIVKQLLTESLMLASLGGAVGIGMSLAITRVLSRFYATDSEGFHHHYDLGLDWRVLLYSVGLAIFTGILFGLLPAIRSSRQDLATELKGGAIERQTKGLLRHVLVIGQLALSMALVIASGLLVRSASTVERGTHFDPEHVIVMRLRPELLKYSPQQIETLLNAVDQRLSLTPGVESVAFMEGGEGVVWNWRSGRDAHVSVSGQTTAADALPTVLEQDVSDSFFRTLRVPILQGREFGQRDRPSSARVAVVNEALARRFWSVGSAVGRTLFVNDQPVQIIGVSADMQPRSSAHSPEPHLYFSYWQSDAVREGDIRFAIRVTGDANLLLREVHRVIQSVDANVPVGEDMSLVQQIKLDYTSVLLAQDVISLCSLIALSLSAMGLYSVLAFAVRTRTREIGVRIALGAGRGDVLRLFLKEGMKLSLVGAVTGVIAALLATRLLRSLLFGVEATDVPIYAGVVGLLLLVALAASLIPAARAASVDPIEALRSE
jgi:putative ABC transport system permease protein